MLGLHFLRHGAENGEPGLLVNFQESPRQLRRAIDSLGWDSESLLRPEALDVLYTSPVELQMDTIIQELLRRIDSQGVRRVVIDALGDLERAARDSRRFSDYIYALSQELAERRVTAMLILEAPSPVASGRLQSGRDISEMSDSTLLLAMELGTELTRTIRVLKARGSAHDGALHRLSISGQGMVVA
jgi:circadian clock protein KaiC